MNKELNGYVIYCKDTNSEVAFGVVSDDYECIANSNYIPNRLKHYLVQIEDKRFFEHKGIDIRGISRAFVENLKAGKIIQGGSTISQQVARNILKDNRKTISRKLRETIKAIQLESNYSKDEILNLYFNNVYFGKNLRGIRTAGLYYFGKELDKLNQAELLYLLTILRGPNYYLKRPDKARERYIFLSNTLFETKLISKNRNQKNIKSQLSFKNNQLQPIKSASIPYIIEKTDNEQQKLTSTIDIKIQSFAKQFVSKSKYPLSIIAIKNNKVVAFASSYGTDYPFISKSNVGSTLKPFLYCQLRDSGISQLENFDAVKNSLNWDVREAGYYKSYLNLSEALYYSNNNVFINAASKNNIDNSIAFLADIFKRDKSEFYPSSILGATKKGISLFELASAYSSFFSLKNLTDSRKECLIILNKIFIDKLGFTVENAFLKTGTTNDNKERFAILGNPELTFAVLRNENAINDESKEGGFMKEISRNFSKFFKINKNYLWI
ncbi:transglycosylase domain-containing protein [Flavobacterium sp. ZE23DGlu08]|uniref:transglycosylase domain-containing protein n=1 Tax=Flavobacterium sp. ZE23DGlu08 TaxID=3059026 RepID=UPI00265E9092|nr:transglycosylase domain-containing protein [Flavobacterium sp. ZE23DGlu08]WKL44433.1 transglycosylase domain-containing protein [Flavobacterium sp. ZE23DGlu08]